VVGRKYLNKKVEFDGIKFDSKLEAKSSFCVPTSTISPLLNTAILDAFFIVLNL
jgi:hypothetical protein